MEIPVLIQEVPGKGFVAHCGAPFDWSAEGSTPEAAVMNLRATVMNCIAAGSKIASIEVPVISDPLYLAKAKGMVIEPPKGDHPLLKWAGTHDPNDPIIQEWRKAVEEYRGEVDAADAEAEVQ